MIVDLGNVINSHSYNQFGELAGITSTASGNGLYSADFIRDAGGRIVRKTETILGATTAYRYEYDTAGRLSKVYEDEQLISHYQYDANGNRLSVNNDLSLTITATYDAQDRLVTYGGNTYTYSANGELSARTQASGTTNYEYDEMGNLLRVGLQDGRVINYIVDGLNRRVGKKVNGTLTKVFLWESQLRVAAELDASNNVISRFVYGDKPNVPEYMIKGGVTYQLVTDHLGSVRLVVDSSTGTVAQRIDYDEYAIVESDTNPGFQPFGFAGGLYDADTKLVRFGARDYDAEVGRWTSKDPIGFNGGDNLYSYALNDPLNLLDIIGLSATQQIACNYIRNANFDFCAAHRRALQDRNKSPCSGQDLDLANAEHYLFALCDISEDPQRWALYSNGMLPSGYALLKKLGIVSGRTPASLSQIYWGSKAAWDFGEWICL